MFTDESEKSKKTLSTSVIIQEKKDKKKLIGLLLVCFFIIIFVVYFVFVGMHQKEEINTYTNSIKNENQENETREKFQDSDNDLEEIYRLKLEKNKNGTLKKIEQLKCQSINKKNQIDCLKKYYFSYHFLKMNELLNTIYGFDTYGDIYKEQERAIEAIERNFDMSEKGRHILWHVRHAIDTKNEVSVLKWTSFLENKEKEKEDIYTLWSLLILHVFEKNQKKANLLNEKIATMGEEIIVQKLKEEEELRKDFYASKKNIEKIRDYFLYENTSLVDLTTLLEAEGKIQSLEIQELLKKDLELKTKDSIEKAKTFIYLHEEEKAAIVLRNLLSQKEYVNDPHVLFLLGRSYEPKDLIQAREYYERSMTSEPNAESLYAVMEILEKKDKKEELIEALKKLCDQFLFSLNMRIKLAQELFELSKNREAEKNIQDILLMNQGHREANLLYAKIFQERRQYEKAIDVYDKMLSLNIEDTQMMLLKAKILLQNMNNAHESLEILSRVIHLDSNFGEAYYLMGFAWRDLGKTERARESFEKYLQLEPNSEHAVEIKKMLNIEK